MVKNRFYRPEAFEEHWHFPHITTTSQRTKNEPVLVFFFYILEILYYGNSQIDHLIYFFALIANPHYH